MNGDVPEGIVADTWARLMFKVVVYTYDEVTVPIPISQPIMEFENK